MRKMILAAGVICVASLAMPFLVLRADAPVVVSDAEIDARFGATNPPSRLRAVAYPLLTNLQHQAASFAPGELRRVQYHLMTNFVMSIASTNYDWDAEFDDRVSLFGWVAGFNVVEEDPAAFAYCADYLGGIVPVSTTGLSAEGAEALAAHGVSAQQDTGSVLTPDTLGPNMRAFQREYRRALHYNQSIVGFRSRWLTRFHDSAVRILSSLPDEERDEFRSNVVIRAGLSPIEANKLFSTERP